MDIIQFVNPVNFYGHLFGFSLGVFTNKTAMHTSLCVYQLSFLLGKYLEVEQQDQMIGICLTF